VCAGVLSAQSSAPSTPSTTAPNQPGQQDKPDNPFPEDSSQAAQPQKPASGQSGSKPDSTTAQPKSSSDNPFPGEDPNAPVIPVPGGGSGADSSSAGSGDGSGGVSRRGDDPDGDPVRSPDSHAHMATGDGFSSSRRGLNDLPAEDDGKAKPGQSARVKTREQTVKEDIDVGNFYIDKRNWKAAQARFTSAFSLDSENPDAVFGLAETERHLQLYKEAAGHYKLFLSYDPDGPHSKAARKGLEEAESASPSVSAASKTASPQNSSPR
jgi:tetratricopeptide (TPR) repeat protein